MDSGDSVECGRDLRGIVFEREEGTEADCERSIFGGESSS